MSLGHHDEKPHGVEHREDDHESETKSQDVQGRPQPQRDKDADEDRQTDDEAHDGDGGQHGDAALRGPSLQTDGEIVVRPRKNHANSYRYQSEPQRILLVRPLCLSPTRRPRREAQRSHYKTVRR